MLKRKKRYKHAIINKKKYYFYSIRWFDITGDAGHKKSKKFLITFSSYDETDEVFSDTNIFPIGCIIKMEKIEI